MDNNYIIEIILRARDEIAGQLGGAIGEMNKMREESSRLGSSLDRLSDKMQEVSEQHKKMKEVFGDLSKVATVVREDVEKSTQATKASTDAQRANTNEAKRSADQTARTAKTQAEARERAKELISQVDRLSEAYKQGQVSNKDYGTELEVLNFQLSRLRSGLKDTDDDLRSVTRTIRDNKEEMSRLRRETDHTGGQLGWFARHLQNLGDHMERTNMNVARLDNQLRGLAVAGLIAFAQQAITVLAALGGEMVAVGSSAIMAGGAIGAAFTSAAAQALPALGLIAAAFARVKDVTDAMKAATQLDQAQATQGDDRNRRQANSANQVANALDGVKSAQEGVANAQRAVKDAQERVIQTQEREADAIVALTEARKAGRRELQDLILAQKEAELVARGAALSQEEAQDRLRESMSSGTGGLRDVEQDRLSVDESRLNREQANLDLVRQRGDTRRAVAGGVDGLDSVKQARRSLADAREAVEDAKEGVNDAIRAVAKAEQGVARARRGVENAQRSANNAATGNLAAAAKLNYLLSQMTDSERRLYHSLTRLRETYRQTFRSVTDTIVDSFSRAVNRIEKIIDDKRIVGPMQGLAGSIASAVDETSENVTSSQNLDKAEILIDESARNVPILSQAVNSLIRAFMSLAVEAAPIFRDLVGWTRDLAVNFERTTANADGMANFVGRSREHLHAWKDLIVATFGLLIQLIDKSEGSGLTTVERLTEKVREGAQWIENHSEQVEQFFEDSRLVMEQVARVLWDIGKLMMNVFNAERVKNMADVIEDSILPALEIIIKAMGAVTDAIMFVLDLPLVGTLAAWLLALVGIGKMLNSLGKMWLLLGNSILKTGASFSSTQGIMSRIIGAITGQTRQVNLLTRAWATLGATSRAAAATTATAAAASSAALGGAAATSTAAAGAAGVGGAAVAGAAAGRHRARDPRTGRYETREAAERRQREADDRQREADEREARRQQNRTRNRRLGIAGLVAGAVASSETGPGDVRNVGSMDLANNSLKSLASSVFTLDLKGVGNTFSRLFKETDFQKFGKGIDETFKRMQKMGDYNGLRKLGQDAEKWGKKFPEYADQLAEIKGAADKAADGLEATRKKIGDLDKRFRGAFRRSGDNKGRLINPEDIIDHKGVQVSIQSTLDSFKRLRSVGVTSVKHLRDDMKSNLDRINIDFETGSQSWANMMAKHFGAGIDAMTRNMREGRKVSKTELTEINRITRQQMRFARDNMDNLSLDAKNRLANNLDLAARATASSMSKAERESERGMRKIRRAFGQSLALYGLDKKEHLDRYANGQDPLTGKSLDTAGGKAEGGFIGNEGERGADSFANTVGGHPVGRGEAVVFNWGHQKYINTALNAQYGHGLGDMFKRVRSEHARALPGGFAGGFAGVSPSGNRTVPIPGFQGEFIAARVLNDAMKLIKKFNLFVTDAFATSGHDGAGHLRHGTAIDVTPRDGNWDNVDRAVAFARNKGLTVLYNGIAGHGRGHHAHIELEKGAMKGVAGGIAQAAIKMIPKFKAQGMPEGALKSIVEGTVNQVRKGANMRLRQAQAANEAEQSEAGSQSYFKVPAGGGNVAKTILAVWRKMNLPKKFLLAAIETGIVESGLRNLPGGDRDSVGWRQERGHYGSAAERMNVAHGAQRIFREMKQFDRPGMSAGLLAANVQRPQEDLRGRYEEEKEAAIRVLRALGVRGFKVGGSVPGSGEQPIIAHGGEHVWTAAEVARAGGHKMMFALRSLFGNAGQGGPTKYEQGGRVLSVGDSLGVGVERYLEKAIKKLDSYNKVSRNSDQAFDILKKRLKDAHEKVILDIGTNDSTAGMLAKNVRRALKVIGDDRELILSRLHGPGSRAKNRILERIDANNDNVTLVSPKGKIGPDGIHYTPQGYRTRSKAFISQAKAEAASKKDAGKSPYEQPDINPYTYSETMKEVDTASDIVKKLFLRTGKKVKNGIDKVISTLDIMTKPEGLLDQAAAAFERRTSRIRNRFQRSIFTRVPGSNLLQRNPSRDEFGVDEANRSLEIEQNVLGGIGNQRSDVNRELRRVTRQMGRKNVSEKQRQNFEKLRRNLLERQAALNEAYATQEETVFNAQKAAVDAAISAVNTRAEQRETGFNLRERMAKLFGNTGELAKIADERIYSMEVQATEIRGLLTNTTLDSETRRALENQLKDIDASIIETTQQKFTDAMTIISEKYSRRASLRALDDRRSDLVAGLGDAIGAQKARGLTMAEEGVQLSNQRAELDGMRWRAYLEGNLEAIKQLDDQIAELDVSIAENSLQQRNNTAAVRQLSLDAIANNQQFKGGITGGLEGILQAVAQVTGSSTVASQLALAQSAGTTLAQTAEDYANTALSDYGINVQNLHGQAFVAAMQAINYDAIMAGMTPEEQTTFQNLINSLIQTEQAIQENTQATNELSGAYDKPQEFQTSAWQQFRQAIFNGMGSLLPQYASVAPPMSSGGRILRDGLLYGHAGEDIIPAMVSRERHSGGSVEHTHLHVTNPTEVLDTNYVVEKLAFHRSVRGR